MHALPSSVSPYKRTPEFSEVTVPPALLKSHTTKKGVWGCIRILEGDLLYRILATPPEEVRLSPSRPGIVEPEMPHEVQIVGPVRFFVEFHRSN